MKKLFALLLAVTMVLAFAGCVNNEDKPSTNSKPDSSSNPSSSSKPEDPADDPAKKGEGVMTYAEYAEAELDTKVVIEAYIQAKQSWWEKDGQGMATFYTQDLDGAYFLYNMPCTKEDYDKMAPGTKLKVTGFKSDYRGEVEITDATYEILNGTYTANPVDVTELLSNEAELVKRQNQKVSFKGMTVEAANENGDAFMYKYNGSGSEGDDLYFKVSVGGATYTLCVESNLCDKDSDVYKAVKGLKVGDTVDLEGFLYWYDGVQPHITGITVAAG